MIYGQIKKDIGQILRKLCEQKDIEIIEAEACPDHIHMLISFSPKYSISYVMGYLKGKSSLMIFDRHANLKYKYGNRHFWARGYFVDQAAIQAAQDALTAAQNKLEEIEQENKKAENDCSNLFTWASTYQNASFQQRQAILNQFIKEVRVGRDYDIEIILNVPLEEFEEFKSHSLSVRTPSGRKTDLKQAPVRGLGTPNGGIVVFDKTSGEAMNIMPKSSAHVTLRCQDE